LKSIGVANGEQTDFILIDSEIQIFTITTRESFKCLGVEREHIKISCESGC